MGRHPYRANARQADVSVVRRTVPVSSVWIALALFAFVVAHVSWCHPH
jgi:hypothetical protein